MPGKKILIVGESPVHIREILDQQLQGAFGVEFNDAGSSGLKGKAMTWKERCEEAERKGWFGGPPIGGSYGGGQVREMCAHGITLTLYESDLRHDFALGFGEGCVSYALHGVALPHADSVKGISAIMDKAERTVNEKLRKLTQ